MISFLVLRISLLEISGGSINYEKADKKSRRQAANYYTIYILNGPIHVAEQMKANNPRQCFKFVVTVPILGIFGTWEGFWLDRNEFAKFHALHAHMPYVLMCLTAFRVYVPLCFTCLRAFLFYLRTYLCVLRAYVPNSLFL